MKKPKQPEKPRRPTEPNRYLPTVKDSHSIYDGTSLADILKATAGIDPSDIHFKSTCGYYDDYDYQFEWEALPRLNPRYEKEMIEYEKKMAKYNQSIEIYNSDLKEYGSLNKQYLKWFYENELKKLVK